MPLLHRSGRENSQHAFSQRSCLFRLRIVAKFPDVTDDNIIQLGPNHVIYSDYYTFELTKDGKTRVVDAASTFQMWRVPESSTCGDLLATWSPGPTDWVIPR